MRGSKGMESQELVEREHFSHPPRAKQVRDFTEGCELLLPLMLGTGFLKLTARVWVSNDC